MLTSAVVLVLSKQNCDYSDSSSMVPRLSRTWLFIEFSYSFRTAFARFAHGAFDKLGKRITIDIENYSINIKK